MRQYITGNTQLFFTLIVWLIIGMYGGPLIYLVLPLSLFMLRRQERTEEMLIGFLFILILSDSYETHLHFAKSLKNVYVSMLALFLFIDSGEFQPLNSIYKSFFPFFLIAMFCLLFTESFGVSVQKTISYFLMYLIIPNYLVRLYRENGPEVLRNIVFFMLTIMIIGIVAIVVAPSLAYTSGRYRGLLGNPNGLGLFCFLSFLFFYVVKHAHKELFTRSQEVLIYAVVVLSLVLTGSRNSIIGVFMFLFFQRFYKMSPLIGFMVVIVVGYLAEVIGNNLPAIISSLGLGDFFRVKTLNDGSGRYIAWSFAWKAVQQNIFIGKGFAYDEFYMHKNWDELSRLGHQGGVHNTFLTFWLDTGLIGLLAFLWGYFVTFLRAAKRNPLTMPIMFVVTFTAFFESWLVGSLNPHTIIFLMILAVISDDAFYTERVPVAEEENPETDQLLLNDYGLKA